MLRLLTVFYSYLVNGLRFRSCLKAHENTTKCSIPRDFFSKISERETAHPQTSMGRGGDTSPLHPISVNDFGVSMSLPKTNPPPSDNLGSATECTAYQNVPYLFVRDKMLMTNCLTCFCGNCPYYADVPYWLVK